MLRAFFEESHFSCKKDLRIYYPKCLIKLKVKKSIKQFLKTSRELFSDGVLIMKRK